MTQTHGDYSAQVELLDRLVDAPATPPRRRSPYVALAFVVVAAALGVAVVLTRDGGPSGPPHPATWDAKVQKYVNFVEKKRGLDFKHPVYVDFMPAKEFRKQVTRDRAELSGDDLEELDSITGMFRALGLFEGDVDLFDRVNELQGKSIIGFYSYDDERLRIKGTKITPAVESTIVHELTHALQDQNFDLGKRFQELDKADDTNASAASEGYDALVEGDARGIETKWRDSLSDKERKALDQEQADSVQGFESASKGIPEVLKTLLAAPYDLGQALLAVADQQGGSRAVDDLFRSPPSTEEQLLDPWALVADHQGYLSVPDPAVPDGEKAFEDGAFGAVGWLLVLSERLPPEQALTAVDGWGGDAMAAYDSDGVSCVTINYRGDTEADLGQMQSALGTWVAKGPKGSASVTREDLTLVLHSCDPGKDATRVSSGKSGEAVALALTRTYLSLAMVKGGLEVPVARCGADRLVRLHPVEQLSAGKVDKAQMLQALAPCRKQP